MSDQSHTDDTGRSSNDGAKGVGVQNSAADDSVRLRTKMYFGIGAGGK